MSEPDPTEARADLARCAQQRLRRLRLFAFIALVPTLVAVGLATLGPITSGDLWWHLRTGEWILAHGELPKVDPFSHTAGDTHWVLQEYGSQVLFALFYELGGFWALKALGALLGLAILVVVFFRARAELRTSWAVAFTALFALLFALKWELRPHLISLLFFFWLERCLFPRGRTLTAKRFATPPPRRLLELGLLAMVWVQLHAEALFAPLLTLAVATGAGVAVLREKASPRHALVWAGMFGAALVGSLASPLFAEPHVYALVGRGVPQLYIEEWFRPWVLPGDPRFAPVSLAVFGAYWAALAVGLGFVLVKLRRRFAHAPGNAVTQPSAPLLAREVSWERLAFLAGCLLFAISARRFFWLTWFPLLDAFAWWLHHRKNKVGVAHFAWAVTLACGVATLCTHYPAAAWRSIEHGRGAEVVDDTLFPVHAANFARDAGLEGKLFHPYEWGGYLGFVTEQPVFIDGRTVLFEKVIPERWLAENDLGQRQQVLEARGVDIIVMDRFVETPAGLAPWQPGGGKWVAAWVDERAVVWVRRGSPNEARVRAFWDADGVAFDALDGISAAAINVVHPEWLEQRRLLLPLLVAELRAAEDAAGTDALARSLARARYWQARRLGKNLRAELKHALGLSGAEGAAAALAAGDLARTLELLEKASGATNAGAASE